MQSTFMTPLMCAAINGHMTTAQILMESGCDPNLTDVNDKTALQLAHDKGKKEVFGFLDRNRWVSCYIYIYCPCFGFDDFPVICTACLVKHTKYFCLLNYPTYEYIDCHPLNGYIKKMCYNYVDLSTIRYSSVLLNLFLCHQFWKNLCSLF